MNKELVHEIVGGIDPALVEEADEAVRAHKKHPPRLGRAGMIAACLCLVLAGTGAAAIANGWVRLSNVSFVQYPQANGSLLSIADVQVAFDGKVYVPWESFSQECRDFLGSFYGMPQYKGFDTWDELEEFLGLNIMDNPVLDKAKPVVHDNTSSLGGRTETGSCFVGFTGYFEAPRVMLSALYQLGTDTDGGLSLYIRGDIFTQPLDLEEPITSFQTYAGESVETETYVTPSGMQAVISVVHHLDAFGTDTAFCTAFFQMNDVLFFLTAHRQDGSPEQTAATVKEILDAFS